MAYEKTTWATGDIISAEKLNHAEDGIKTALAGMLHYDDTAYSISESYNDILNMMAAGVIPWVTIKASYAGTEYHHVCRLHEYHVVENQGYSACFYAYNPTGGPFIMDFTATDPDEPMSAGGE